MYQPDNQDHREALKLAQMGADAVAYMREISSSDIEAKFPGVDGIEEDGVYWALFAADGTPLMIASEQDHLMESAFYNDLKAVLPN